MRGRAWPIDDEALGSGSQVLSEASWTKVSLVLAELDARLDKFPPSLKGELLRSECKDPKKFGIDDLSNNAKDALYYLVGERKATRFVVWLAKREERIRKRYKKYTLVKNVRS